MLEGVDDFYIARNAEVSKTLFAPCNNFIGSGVLAFAQNDVGSGHFNQPRVGNADYLRLLDLRMFMQNVLDFRRGDIFAADTEYIFDASEKAQPALGIHYAEVTAVQPLVRIYCLRGLLGHLVITFHHAPAADIYFTCFAGRQRRT